MEGVAEDKHKEEEENYNTVGRVRKRVSIRDGLGGNHQNRNNSQITN